MHHHVSSVMKTVSISSSFTPYHIAFADVIYFNLLGSPSPFIASTTFWNGLATLQQQGVQQQQLMEFLDRISKRLSAPASSNSGTQKMGSLIRAQIMNSQIRFGGQSARNTVEQVKKTRALIASAEQSNAPTLSVSDHASKPESFKYLFEQIEIAKRIVSGISKNQAGVSINNSEQHIAVERTKLLQFKYGFILLYNKETDNQGIHTILTENRNKILIFESEQDATKFSEMLEDHDFPRLVVQTVEIEQVEKFCKDEDYDWELVLKGALIVPPASNADTTGQ